MATSLTESTQDELQTLKVTPGVFNIKHEEDEDYRGTVVTVVDAEHITAGTHTFSLVKDYRDGFDAERFGQRFEQILNKYDYVVGDWGFEQLRLRGFYNDKNHSANRDQTISTLQDYLLEFCNFGCAFFVLQNSAPERVHQENHQTTSNNGGNKVTRHNTSHHSTSKQPTRNNASSNRKKTTNQPQAKTKSPVTRNEKSTSKPRDHQKNKNTKPRTNQKSTRPTNQKSSASQPKPVAKKPTVDHKNDHKNSTTTKPATPRQHEFHIRQLDK